MADIRRLDIHLRSGDTFDVVMKAVKAADPVDFYVMCPEQTNRRILSVFLHDGMAQGLSDRVQSCLEGESGWRLIITDIEASAPQEAPDESAEETVRQATREEIYSDVGKDAALDINYIVLIVLSAIVATIGLNTNSVASVIGAMVIAPLLGPVLAFTLGASLGDDGLLRRASLSLVTGILIALGVSLVIAYLVELNMDSQELLSRAEVRLDSVALAMAAGAAAALSLARGQASVLVGVMVAAALLPPISAVGLFLGSGYFPLALRSALLLALNLASLILSGLIVFWVKGIRPRGWIEQENALRAVVLNAGLSALFLAVSVALIIYLRLGDAISVGS